MVTERLALVLCGVSGSGKTTVAKIISGRRDWVECEADELQPAINVAKMRARMPLTDLDRQPWLSAVRQWIDDQQGPVVVSCSALRRSYRDVLRQAARPVLFVQLEGGFDLVWPRLSRRGGPFMSATQLESQYAALESLQDDEPVGRVGVDADPDAVADRVLELVDSSVDQA